MIFAKGQRIIFSLGNQKPLLGWVSKYGETFTEVVYQVPGSWRFSREIVENNKIVVK